MMDNAVRNDGSELAVPIRHGAGVHFLQSNAAIELRLPHIVAADRQHMFREVDRHDVADGRLTAELDRDLCRAGANIEDRPAPIPVRQEVRDKNAVDRGVVHRVVIARFRGGVHDFRFEDALDHDHNVKCADSRASRAP